MIDSGSKEQACVQRMSVDAKPLPLILVTSSATVCVSHRLRLCVSRRLRLCVCHVVCDCVCVYSLTQSTCVILLGIQDTRANCNCIAIV